MKSQCIIGLVFDYLIALKNLIVGKVKLSEQLFCIAEGYINIGKGRGLDSVVKLPLAVVRVFVCIFLRIKVEIEGCLPIDIKG